MYTIPSFGLKHIAMIASGWFIFADDRIYFMAQEFAKADFIELIIFFKSSILLQKLSTDLVQSDFNFLGFQCAKLYPPFCQ